MATAKKTAPPSQSEQEARVEKATRKIENFRKLANKRVSRTLQSIDMIARLSNRRSYTYTDEQVTKILNALKTRFQALESAFTSPSGSEEQHKFEV